MLQLLCCGHLNNVWPVTGEVLADPFLVVPQQAMQSQHVTVTDEGQTVVDGVAGWRVRRYVQEKPAVICGEFTPSGKLRHLQVTALVKEQLLQTSRSVRALKQGVSFQQMKM